MQTADKSIMSEKLSLTRYLRAIFVALTIGIVGCNNVGSLINSSSTSDVSSAGSNNLPRVVATTSVLCDLTKQVAAETINLSCLVSPDADPHLYQPKPEDRKAIEEAQIIFFNGYNLEPSLFKLIRASDNNAVKIAVAQRAVRKPLQVRENGKTLPDPHVWHDAKNGIRMVEVISAILAKQIPENASLYKSNTQKIKNELTQMDAWIKSRIASIPPTNRNLVTTHNALGYYVRAYGLSYIGTLQGISTDEKPTNARVQGLVQQIQQARVPTIFPESTINTDLINTVAKNAQVKVSERQLFTDNLGATGNEGDTYQKMLSANTRTIVEGLGGTYLMFEPQAAK